MTRAQAIPDGLYSDVPRVRVPLTGRLLAVVDLPETHYATTADGVRIAYQVVGEGPPDVVFVGPFTSHVELGWESPVSGPLLRRLASFRGWSCSTSGAWGCPNG